MKKILILTFLMSIAAMGLHAQSRTNATGNNARGMNGAGGMEIIKFEQKVVADNVDSKSVKLVQSEMELKKKLAEAKKAKEEYLSMRYPEYKALLSKKMEKRNTRAKRAKKGNRKATNRLKMKQ